MPCLIGCLALAFPRVVMVVVWLLSPGFIGKAFTNIAWPIVGFIFMPLTTLAYAFAFDRTGGTITPGYVVLIIVAALFDLGLTGGASRRKKYRTPP